MVTVGIFVCHGTQFVCLLQSEVEIRLPLPDLTNSDVAFCMYRTCFYVLGLVATTRQGADILKALNWESVRHKGEDSWPVVEVKEEALPYSKWFVSSLSAATG